MWHPCDHKSNHSGRRVMGFVILCLFGLCLVMGMTPRGESAPRPQNDSRVHLLHADRLYYNEQVHRTAQFLVGDVRFSHDGTLMYCDSALYYEASNSFDAFGHVRMVQGDTLSLVSEVLYYNGFDELAQARHNVVLKHRKTTLYTDSLDYDRLYDLGYFFEGGRLVDEDNELTSDWGEYSPATRDAVFRYNVKLVNPPKNPKSTLISDTLYYNTRTAIARVAGPSNIEHGDSHIYSEAGYYDTRTDQSYLLDRSILTYRGKRLVGDSVCHDSKTKISKAFGNVVYTDEVNKNMFLGNYCMYNDSIGYSEAADSAVVIDYSQRDTMYAHADSIKAYTRYMDTDSMYREVHAFHHVRAYRVDLQGVCDSLVYIGKDSCITMYRDPIVWQQGQQLLGEEIRAFVNDSTVDSVQVLRQTLMVERLDSLRFNQVAGNEIHTYMLDGKPTMTHVIGNVYVNYFMMDDDSLLIGMNHSESSELRLQLKDSKVDYIWMPAATASLYPPVGTPACGWFLENFAWFDYIRPRDKNDIFEWRPKKAGLELKASEVRVAPKQKLHNIKR